MRAHPQFDSFGARLKYWREVRGFSRQGDLAAKIKISQPSLSELEKGHSKQPSAEVLLKLADVLQLRPKYLLNGEGVAESQYFSDLNGLEAQLVMIFRQLPTDALRDSLLIDADAMLQRAVRDETERLARSTFLPPKPITKRHIRKTNGTQDA